MGAEFKRRTEAKIDYAKLMLEELSQRSPRAGRGDSFERAHEEAVLFHVIGAKDAFLQEMNEYYNLGLKCSNVTEKTLSNALKTKGKTCQALEELDLLKTDEYSWLSKANLLRNHGTHRGKLYRTFFAGGEHDGEVFYKDPRNSNKHISEEDTYKYLDHCIQEMEKLIRDLRDKL